MNLRIRQLADEAAKYSAIMALPTGQSGNELFVEKFAELIIQECFQACMNEGASYEEKAAGAYQSNLYVTAIKKHFGIEE